MADKERESWLIDQWVSLTEERNAVVVPVAGSGIPGAPPLDGWACEPVPYRTHPGTYSNHLVISIVIVNRELKKTRTATAMWGTRNKCASGFLMSLQLRLALPCSNFYRCCRSSDAVAVGCSNPRKCVTSTLTQWLLHKMANSCQGSFYSSCLRSLNAQLPQRAGRGSTVIITISFIYYYHRHYHFFYVFFFHQNCPSRLGET